MAKGKETQTKKLKTIETYHFKFADSKITVLSKEIIMTGSSITQIHYPFDFKGDSKYKTIKRFIYKGFARDALPVGVSSSPLKGYGFTRHLRVFADFINKNYKFTEIIIANDQKSVFDIDNSKLYLNEETLRELKKSFDTVEKKNKVELKTALEIALYNLFPSIFKKPKRNSYIPGSLANTINSWSNVLNEFTDNDKKAIRDLFDKLSFVDGFLADDSLSKTKEIIDNQYLKKTLTKYKELLQASTMGEKRWQDFLRTHSWIFSSILAQPVILYQAEAFVGGKKLDNTDGKITDFLLQNSLSDNISFLEIKTHKTILCEQKSYRGSDVFSPSGELTGAMVQVLNQRDNFQKEYYANIAKSRKGKPLNEAPTYETYNSRCVILCGLLSDLTPSQRPAFELFRNNSKDVEIFTFDELEAKIVGLQNLLNK